MEFVYKHRGSIHASTHIRKDLRDAVYTVSSQILGHAWSENNYWLDNSSHTWSAVFNLTPSLVK